MRRLIIYLLGSVSSVALGTALADETSPREAGTALPAPSWSGTYAGVNLGGIQHSARFSDLGNPTAGQLAFFPISIARPFWAPRPTSFTGGVQVGHNWQLNGMVVGVEGDFNLADGGASRFFPAQTVSAATSLDWYATMRGRLGVSFSSAMIYVTGGVAFADIRNTWGGPGALGARFLDQKTRVGWVFGGGVEYMINRHWTVRLEAFHADFGTSSQSVNAGGTIYTSSFANKLGVVRGGVNYKW